MAAGAGLSPASLALSSLSFLFPLYLFSFLRGLSAGEKDYEKEGEKDDEEVRL
jgi:hypothetical protein